MGNYTKTIEHLRQIASGRDKFEPSLFGSRGLRCRRGRVVAILPGVIAAAIKEGENEEEFVGWYENKEAIFVVYDEVEDGYLALNTYCYPVVHPHVNGTEGNICLGNNEDSADGAISALLAINLDSVYFMPRLSVEKPTDNRPRAVIRL